jgi:tape measure domain-containing protein
LAIRIGAIEVVLRTDLDQFTGGLRRAASEVDQQGGRITRSTERVARNITEIERRFRSFDGGIAFRGLELSALRASSTVERLRNVMLLLPAALGGTFAALGTRQLTDLADEATRVRNRINVVVQGTAQRAQAEEQIFEIAQRTRQEYGATAQMFSRTAMAAQNLGRSQGEVLQFVEAVQKTNLISGSTTQEASSAAIQLSQGLASNRLQGDELRSVLENNVALTQILAQELAGGDVGRLREMGSEGALTAQAVMDAVLRRREEIDRRFGQSSPLISQGLVYLNNALIRYVGVLDQASGASERLGAFLRWMGDNVPGIASAIMGLSAALVALAAIRIGGSRIGVLVGDVKERVAASRAAALGNREAAADALARAREEQAAIARQAATAKAAVQSVASAPIMATAAPISVQKLSAAEEAYASAKRRVADIDARLASNEAARARVAGQVAVQRERFLNREADAIRRVAEAENAAMPAARRLAEARAALDQGQTALAGLERGVAKSEREGRAGFAKAGRELIEAQREENARRLQALQIAEREYQEKAARIQQQESRLAKVRAGGALDVENQQRRIDQKVAVLDRQREELLAERTRATNAVASGAASVSAARSGVEASAEQRLTDLKNASAIASRNLAEADRRVAAASAAAADAQRRFAAVSSALGTVKTGLLATGASLVSFLGGPWGVAFALASAGIGLFAYQQARAAEEAQRHKRALEGLPEAIKAVEEARRSAATTGRTQPEAEISASSQLEQARQAQRAGIAKLISDMRASENPRALLDLLSEAGAAPALPQPIPAGASTEQRRRYTADLMAFSQALQKVQSEGSLSVEQIERISAGLSRVANGAGISAVAAESLLKQLSDLRSQASLIAELSSGRDALRRNNALNARDADDPTLSAQRQERVREIQSYEKAVASAATTAKSAEATFKAMADEVMKPLSDGASGYDLAQRAGITEQAKASIQQFTAAMAELSMAASNMPSGPLRDLVSSFVAGAIPMGEFKARIDALRQANPDLGGVIRGIEDAAKTAETSRGAILSLQRAIDALTGKTINIMLRISEVGSGQPDMAEADGLARRAPSAGTTQAMNRIVNRNALGEALRRSRLSKEERGIEDYRQQFPSATDAELRELYQNNQRERRGRGDADAKQYAKTLRELREEAASFSLSEIDRETVRYSRTARVAEADVKAFIDAMSAGRTNDIPPRIRAIREELEKTFRLRTQKEFRDRYATDEERYAKELQRLQQAGFDDATFQQFRGRLARSIFGDPGGDLAKGFTEAVKAAVNGDWQGALRGLGQRFMNTLIDVMFKPLERQLAELFRSLFDQIMPGGGIGGLLGLGNLLSGGGSVTAGGALSAFSSYHDGGIAGSGPVAGFAPASLWNSAPRYHSGLRAGELRAVLMAGERVLTQADSERTMRTIAGLSRAAEGGGGAVGRPVVQVINQGPTQPEVSTMDDGTIRVLIPSIEAGMAARAGRREGALYGAMGQVLGVPATGALRGV